MKTLRPLALTVAACASLTALVGCSSSSAPAESTSGAATSAPSAGSESGSGSGDFCTDFKAAGGNLTTTSNFQVGLPADQTISDLTARVAVLDAATPPSDIEDPWQTTRDLYTETITIAEASPDKSAPLLDSRVLAIVKDLSEPTRQIRDYIDASC